MLLLWKTVNLRQHLCVCCTRVWRTVVDSADHPNIIIVITRHYYHLGQNCLTTTTTVTIIMIYYYYKTTILLLLLLQTVCLRTPLGRRVFFSIHPFLPLYPHGQDNTCVCVHCMRASNVMTAARRVANGLKNKIKTIIVCFRRRGLRWRVGTLSLPFWRHRDERPDRASLSLSSWGRHFVRVGVVTYVTLLKYHIT